MDFDAQRAVYLKLLETEEDPSVCRGYLRRLGELEGLIADAREEDRTVIDAEAREPAQWQAVEVPITTEPPVEDGIELEVIVDPLHVDDWFENVETALYQRSTAGYPVVEQRFRQCLPSNGHCRRSAS